MLWNLLGRFTTVLGIGITLKNLRDDRIRESSEISPHRIYSSREVAILLGIQREEVVRKLKKKELKGRMVNGNYRIPGASILDYLKHEI